MVFGVWQIYSVRKGIVVPFLLQERNSMPIYISRLLISRGQRRLLLSNLRIFISHIFGTWCYCYFPNNVCGFRPHLCVWFAFYQQISVCSLHVSFLTHRWLWTSSNLITYQRTCVGFCKSILAQSAVEHCLSYLLALWTRLLMVVNHFAAGDWFCLFLG